MDLASSSPTTELSTLRRSPGVEEAPLHGELMLFDASRAKFFVLNRTMRFLWGQCDGRQTLDGALDRLCEEFEGVDRAAAAEDLRRALEELQTLGLVVGANTEHS